MLFQLLDELMTNPARFPVVLLTFATRPGLGHCATVHEFSHAAVATGLGDTRPADRAGPSTRRVTDPMGTLPSWWRARLGSPRRVDPRYSSWLSLAPRFNSQRRCSPCRSASACSIGTPLSATAPPFCSATPPSFWPISSASSSSTTSSSASSTLSHSRRSTAST
jgi:hypothetical protein